MDLTMSSSSLSLLFLISLQIHFPVPASGYFQPFLDCAPSNCGDEEISYPFRHNEQPTYCGFPGYELGCDSHNPTLFMESLEYRVIHMNMSAQILEVARMDLSDGICLGAHVNTTLNSSLFDYTSSDFNSTLFYDCKPTPQSYHFSCPTSQDGYFALDVDLANTPHELCNFSVLVPISQSDEAPTLPPPSEGSDVSATTNHAAISLLLNKGFEITWIADTSQCKNCTISGGRCGYDWTKQEFNCFCSDGAYPRTCHGPSGKPGNLGTKAIVGIAALGTGIGIALILMISFRKKPISRRIIALIKQRSEHFDGEMKIEGLVSSRRYTYKAIKRMTNFFEEKLGQGGYGCVYKGKLRDGQLVAVKLLKKLKGDAEEFFNEVASISRTSHVNVVSLLGFCFEGSKRALIYEFMPNGSLEKFISSKSNNLEVDQLLSWDTLYQISLGIAHGLEY